MRLNFSGVTEDDIREGVRRIGKVVREQVGLYGTLTGAAPAESAAAAPVPASEEELSNVLHLPPRGDESSRRDAR